MLSLNYEGKVMFKCPVCRRNSVYRKKYECESRSDKKFSRFCFTVPAITSKIFDMYVKETKKNLDRNYDSDYFDDTVSLFHELESTMNASYQNDNFNITVQNRHDRVNLLAMRENDFLNIE